MPPRIAIFVRGGVVQEVARDTTVLSKLLDMDSIEEGDIPDEWRAPDIVIDDRERFEAYTSGGYTTSSHPPISPHRKSTDTWA